MSKSILESLTEIANKLDPPEEGKEVKPDYKNPERSVEKLLERIAEHFNSGSGGGQEVVWEKLYKPVVGEPIEELIEFLDGFGGDTAIMFENVDNASQKYLCVLPKYKSGGGGGGPAGSSGSLYNVQFRLRSGTTIVGITYEAENQSSDSWWYGNIISVNANLRAKTFRVRAYTFE